MAMNCEQCGTVFSGIRCHVCGHRAAHPESATEPEPRPPEPPPAPAPAAAPLEPAPVSAGSSCPHLRVEYNQARRFRVGYWMTIEYRVEPLVAGVGNIQLHVYMDDGSVDQLEPVEELLLPGDRLILPVTLPAVRDHPGKVALKVYVSYELEGEPCRYVARSVHQCYRQTAEDNRAIHLHTEITQGDYGIADLSQTAPAAPARDRALSELDDIDGEPRWALCALRRTAPAKPSLRPVPPRPPAAGVDRLTLHLDGQRRLHLFTGENLWLGLLHKDYKGKRRCDLVTWVFDKDGAPPNDPNRVISRRHAQLLSTGDSVRLIDHGHNGSFVDGARVEQSHHFALDRGTVLQLGDRDDTPGPRFQLAVTPRRVGREDADSEPTGSLRGMEGCVGAVELQRRDGLPESYAIVRSALRLGDAWILHRDAGLLLVTDDDTVWLRPGIEVTIGGSPCRVTEVEQLGVHRKLHQRAQS